MRLRTPNSPVVVGLAGLLCAVVLDLLAGSVSSAVGDERIYELIATHPGATHTFPFAFRVLPPWIVHLFPGAHTAAFSILGWLACGVAAGFTFALLRRLEAGDRLSFWLALSLAASPVLLAADVRQGRSPDPFSVAVLAAGGWCIVARARAWLAVVVLVGVFNRESALFLVPWAYIAWAERPVDWRALRDVSLGAVPAAAAYVVLRTAIPTVGREQVVGYGSGLIQGRIDVIKQNLETPFIAVRRLFLAFGPLWFVAPLALRSSAFARRSAVLAAFCVVSMSFALDWGRIAILAAPAVYGSAALVLKDRPRWQWPVLGAWAALIVVYAVYLRVHGLEQGTPAYPVT